MSSVKVLMLAMQTMLVAIVLVFPALLIYLFTFVFYRGDFVEAQLATHIPQVNMCSGLMSTHKDPRASYQTESGFVYRVKTPLNYDAQKPWPAVLVFSPMFGGEFMESYTGLTGPLTEAGFIVAYVDPVAMALNIIPRLTEVIEAINSAWCIDSRRLYVSGHSNGATISQALHFLPAHNNSQGQLNIAGFISSAAGLQAQDLAQYPCPKPSQAFILHNTGDRHFPDFGKGAAQWWASCNQCDSTMLDIGNGCYSYSGCAAGAAVSFCEQPGSHLKWPERHEEIINFLNHTQ